MEGIARLFNLADLTGLSKNLIIFNKDIHMNAANIEASVFSKKAYTDKFGFRVPIKNYYYDEKKSSVLIVGDSVSFGVGVEEQNTFVGLLRNQFKNLNFYNSSVSGYHLKHYSTIIKKNKNLKRLNEVLIFFTLNDISFKEKIFNVENHIEENKVNKDISFFNKVKENIYLSKLNFFLRNKSVFYMWVKGIVSKPSERHFYYMYPIYQENTAVKEIKNEFENLKKITEKNNLGLSVVILPYEFQTRTKNCSSHFLQPQ